MSLHCPKSVISAQSLYFLDRFKVWKSFKHGTLELIDAKTADALMVLEEVWQKEKQSGEVKE